MRQCMSGQYLESELSDILRHTPPRLPDGRLKRGKCKKSGFAGTKKWLPHKSHIVGYTTYNH